MAVTRLDDLNLDGDLTLAAGSRVFVGDNANANNTAGVTTNQGNADDEIASWKSSDVAHGMTDFAETDTFGHISKASGGDGGVLLRGYTETEQGIVLQAFVTTDSALRTTSATAPVHLTAHFKSGTGITSMGADKNLAVIRNNATTRFIFDSDGDFHADSSSTTF